MAKYKKKNLADKLAEVREAADLSQGQLALLMNKRGFDVKAYSISKWETGVSKPGVEAFLALCDICKVEDIRQTFMNKRLLRLFEIPVSAGPGNYLDDSDYELIEVDNLVPESADYAVRVRGDSMTPRFVDKQIIFIHEQADLGEGDIGIFYLNNEVFLKKLGKGSLVSLNSEYEPIPVGEHDEFKVFGKVIG